MYCPNCGLNNPDNALNCSACGAALGAQAPGAAPPVTPTAAPVAQKSKLTAGLLAIFLGTLGIHNFYLGFTTKAIIQLVVSLLGAAAFEPKNINKPGKADEAKASTASSAAELFAAVFMLQITSFAKE